MTSPIEVAIGPLPRSLLEYDFFDKLNFGETTVIMDGNDNEKIKMTKEEEKQFRIRIINLFWNF